MQRAVAAGKKELQKQQERDIIKQIKELGIRGDRYLIPAPVILDSFSFDDNHINKERNHKIDRITAVSFMQKAKFEVRRWKGRFKNFYSDAGAVFIDVEQKNIRTAFASEEYTEDVLAVLEVLKKYGR